ncbi:unnamed protein product [Tilletia laevis]|nr:unnamed protein product [Tilletia laevis]
MDGNEGEEDTGADAELRDALSNTTHPAGEYVDADVTLHIGHLLLADLPDSEHPSKYICADPHRPEYPPPQVALSAKEALTLPVYTAMLRTEGTVESYYEHVQVHIDNGSPVLSLDIAQRLAEDSSHISTQKYDMCINSCMASGQGIILSSTPS